MAALIAMDYINDVVTENGKAAMAFSEVRRRHVIQALNKATSTARARDWKVIFVNLALDEHCMPVESELRSYLDQSQAFQVQGSGIDLASDVEVADSDIVLRRFRISAFQSPLPNYISPGEALYMCGVTTNFCVSSSVRMGFDLNYPVHIIEDVCASDTQAAHEAEIQILSLISTITTSDAL
ncbi:MAG: isochorismatase family cysteine hydrolase [Pseudomonadota bacterium]